MTDEFDAYAPEKIDRKEEISVKEELKKTLGPPRKSLEIFEDMAVDENDFFLLRCSKPNREEMFEAFTARQKMEMPPRGKL